MYKYKAIKYSSVTVVSLHSAVYLFSLIALWPVVIIRIRVTPMHMVPLIFFQQICFHSFWTHSSVSSPARHLPSISRHTTLQSITITTRKENLKQELRNQTEPPPTPTLHSPSTPLSPPAQPSLLASLLARKRSIVTVPATKEVSPPLRGSSRPSPDRLPYLPHSPFHLFSYDLDEEPSTLASAKPSEESPKTTSPRSDGHQNSKLCVQESTESPPFSLTLHFLPSFSTSVSAVYPGISVDLFASLLLHFTSPFHQLLSVLWLHRFTPSVCQCSCYHLLFLHISFFLLSVMHGHSTLGCNSYFVS